MKKYIFDVDGTLTPSRGKIDPEFLQEMLYFAGTNDVYLLSTGSKSSINIKDPFFC